jgi:hypothetical protein
MSYVVHFRNRTELADPQALFTFTHPNRGECLKLILLSRRIWTNIWHEFDRNSDWQQPLWSLKIPIKCDSMLHGFAGYFDYWTLDVSHCPCLPSENGCSTICTSLFKLTWFTSLVLVPTWLLTILLFTYDCISTNFRDKWWQRRQSFLILKCPYRFHRQVNCNGRSREKLVWH